MISTSATARPRKATRRRPRHLTLYPANLKCGGLSSPGRLISIGGRPLDTGGVGGAAGTGTGLATEAATAKAGRVEAGAARCGGGAISISGRPGRTRKRLPTSASRRGRVALGGRMAGRGVGINWRGRGVTAFGTGCEFPKGIFDVWRCVCIAGRLCLNGSISCTALSITASRL